MEKHEANKLSLADNAFLLFGIVGMLGLVVNTAIFIALYESFGLSFISASLIASEMAVLQTPLLQHIRAAGSTRAETGFMRGLYVMSLATPVLTIITMFIVISVGHVTSPLANLIAVLFASMINYVVAIRGKWVEQPSFNRYISRLNVLKTAVHFRLLYWMMVADHAARWLLKPLSIGAALLTVILVATLHMGAWITLAAACLSLTVFIRPGVNIRNGLTYLLGTLVAISAIDYLAWRVGVVNWEYWLIALPLMAAETFGILHTLGFQYTVWPRKDLALQHDEDPTYRPIFVFIPTVNEGVEILRKTLDGVLQARTRYLKMYPHGSVSIIVCNDGRVADAPCWRQIERLAEEHGVLCVTRTQKGGAKAGNIENARQAVGAVGNALVVIFDADQVAAPEFLLKTIPPFQDSRIGWVQTGQYYGNLENPVARWAHDQQALFYQVLCPGKATQNAAFICGTNVVLRAAALDQIGGLPQDSVTEDFAASIELHQYWHSIFVSGVLAVGLGPMDINSYFKQQGRWAIGTLSVLRNHWRKIFIPGRNGLRFPQRIQYALACTHYLCGLRDLIYVVSPILFLITGIPAVKGSSLGEFFWHFLPYMVTSQLAFWYAADKRTGLRGVLIGFGSFPVLVGSLIAVIIGKRVGFAITAKQRVAARAWWRPVLLHILALIACAVGLLLALRPVGAEEQVKTVVSGLWVLYTTGLLLGMLWLGMADQRASRMIAPPQRRSWQIHLPQRQLRLSTPFAAALVIGCFIGVLAMRQNTLAAPIMHFSPDSESHAPYWGVTLPYDLLESRLPILQSQLGTNFALVGRTQNISDRFDTHWANELAQSGQRPWITLLFLGAGEPTYTASLPAIANGYHDVSLRVWARAISGYGKPVYLTILPHVDRNWAISSAVTNGGIPQDAPRAWAHVRKVFAEEGAVNVAWVWAPADPIHDESYAPPEVSFDITLISLISYPNTAWVDPKTTLATLSRRYPNKPLFVEVSAAGKPDEKAAWLKNVGDAILLTPSVQALLYHEGSPDMNATQADLLPWSLLSDPLTTSTVKSWIQVDHLQSTAQRVPDRR